MDMIHMTINEETQIKVLLIPYSCSHDSLQRIGYMADYSTIWTADKNVRDVMNNPVKRFIYQIDLIPYVDKYSEIRPFEQNIWKGWDYYGG